MFAKRFGFNENFTLRIQYNSGAERRLNLKWWTTSDKQCVIRLTTNWLIADRLFFFFRSDGDKGYCSFLNQFHNLFLYVYFYVFACLRLIYKSIFGRQDVRSKGYNMIWWFSKKNKKKRRKIIHGVGDIWYSVKGLTTFGTMVFEHKSGQVCKIFTNMYISLIKRKNGSDILVDNSKQFAKSLHLKEIFLIFLW